MPTSIKVREKKVTTKPTRDVASGKLVPVFPKFKKLELADRSLIESFTAQFPPYSDFNFTSLWSWNIKNELEFSILNNNLVVKFNDYITEEPFFSFLGSTSLLDTVEQILEFSTEERHLPGKLKLLPEANLIDDSLADSFIIEEEMEDFDYVYNIKLLATYPGLDYTQCRKMMNRFLKRNGGIEVKKIDLSNKETMNSVIKLDKKWQANKKKNFDSKNEERALLKLLNTPKDFSLNNVGVYVGGSLVGCTINEECNDGYVISHFAKFDIGYVGIYSYLMRVTAEVFSKKNYNFINCEQDLGLSGLRYAKRAFRPEFFLKKYTISKR